jgi:hypothetical protein
MDRIGARRSVDLSTTVNPRLASPARAASTLALSARTLVWNAISSMTPMMLVIWFDVASISPIAKKRVSGRAALRSR